MQQLVVDLAEAVRTIDCSRAPFKGFQPGVGPYGEPQLAKLLVQHLAVHHPDRYRGIRTCRAPDIRIPDKWALELKLVRPFGDNGSEAEHWSQNLLHPYPGNVSALGDAMKLMQLEVAERKGIVVIGYEHEPPVRELSPLIAGFELLARELLHLPLSQRYSSIIAGCVHPVHQRATIYGWELKG